VNSASVRTRRMTTAALLAALLSAAAYVAIPVQPVPITLQVFVVVLAALLLPPAWAAAAVGVYLMLGAIGVPVFAGARGGLGVLFGPTGGYLSGFLAGAWAGALVRKAASLGRGRLVPDVLAAVLTIAVAYALGATQLALVTGIGPGKALAAGVLPFLPLDAVKAAVAVAVASALRRAGVASAV
jgi:biotin transport system substrate-specific component